MLDNQRVEFKTVMNITSPGTGRLQGTIQVSTTGASVSLTPIFATSPEQLASDFMAPGTQASILLAVRQLMPKVSHLFRAVNVNPAQHGYEQGASKTQRQPTISPQALLNNDLYASRVPAASMGHGLQNAGTEVTEVREHMMENPRTGEKKAIGEEQRIISGVAPTAEKPAAPTPAPVEVPVPAPAPAHGPAIELPPLPGALTPEQEEQIRLGAMVQQQQIADATPTPAVAAQIAKLKNEVAPVPDASAQPNGDGLRVNQLSRALGMKPKVVCDALTNAGIVQTSGQPYTHHMTRMDQAHYNAGLQLLRPNG